MKALLLKLFRVSMQYILRLCRGDRSLRNTRFITELVQGAMDELKSVPFRTPVTWVLGVPDESLAWFESMPDTFKNAYTEGIRTILLRHQRRTMGGEAVRIVLMSAEEWRVFRQPFTEDEPHQEVCKVVEDDIVLVLENGSTSVLLDEDADIPSIVQDELHLLRKRGELRPGRTFQIEGRRMAVLSSAKGRQLEK